MIQQVISTGGYCIDTSALIDLSRFYPREVFSGLWKAVENLISNGNLVAPREVLEELKQKDDELLGWAKENKRIFVELDDDQATQVKNLLKKYSSLVDPSKTIPEADPFVIVLGKKGYTVVTSEKTSRPGGSMRIPDVCAKEKIKCIPLAQMFRDERWEF